MKTLTFTALGFAMFLGACATETQAVRYDRSEESGDAAKATEVEVGARVSEICHLATNKAYFTTASSALDAPSQDFADGLAKCMMSGDLKGQNILVVGYADPAGSDAYNKGLGLDRSESVASRLVACGVPKERIFVKSAGERKDDPNFYNRRVEIRVAD